MYEPTIKVRHAAQSHDPGTRTRVRTPSERRATGRFGVTHPRDSLALRPMKPWPIAVLAIVVVVLVVIGFQSV